MTETEKAVGNGHEGERECTQCSRTYNSGVDQCPEDGSALIARKPDALIGTIFAEKYEVQSILGQGGMSIVYKARHIYMGRTVALKLLLERQLEDPTAFSRFQMESRAASSLSHQNIVIVHDFGVSSSGQAYFVMDCLEGDSLEDIIDKQGRVPVAKAIDVFRQICDGLSHAHKKNIVHRDLKPSNIVIARETDGSEVVKIVDFGLAKISQNEGAPLEPRLTQTGQVLGSPLYMSPEQCQGYKLDTRSDIYSLGCLMYDALAGTPPFRADSFFNTALLHINQKPPSFQDVAADAHIPQALEDVVMKCLAKDPNDRYENVDQVRQKLLDAALTAGVPGLKPGAVLTHVSGGYSPLKRTWENMRAVIDTELGTKAKRKTSPARLIAIALAAIAAGGALAFFFCFPGPEGDRGTPFDKLRWQMGISFAQNCMDRGDYDTALAALTNSKNIAKTFGDEQARLKLTVEQEALLYHKWNKFAEEEKANQESSDIVTAQIVNDSEGLKKDLDEIDEPASSETKQVQNKLHAAAIGGKILLSSKRLSSRGMNAHNESLLKQAMTSYKKLQLHGTEMYAQFDWAMAECLRAQQRNDEVRPFLTDALHVTYEARNSNKNGMREYIKALLKLGQFDRDQSAFAIADKELFDALKLAQENYPSDKTLMAECMNSCADLARQLGRTAESEKLYKSAKSL